MNYSLVPRILLLLSLHQLTIIANHYTKDFVVEFHEGAPITGKDIDQIANRNGFENLGNVVENFYHFRATESDASRTPNLIHEPFVKSIKQQVAKHRQKRGFRYPHLNWSWEDIRFSIGNDKIVSLNDPQWPQMWYLHRGGGLDMNVQKVWAQNITGKGVVVTILDDGLEKDHPDLSENYDPDASYDFNNHDRDPMPRYDMLDSNRHGTRCAGEVAAKANNSFCTIGIAYGASIGGVRMLDGEVTDPVEAKSLSLNRQHVDIYSASWGPDDDGKTVDGPGPMAAKAFQDGILKGRGGRGSIFVWASGNGGREHDDCNCDGYTNSIWTLSVSSASEYGTVPWYSEACSSTLATTYSSGNITEKQAGSLWVSLCGKGSSQSSQKISEESDHNDSTRQSFRVSLPKKIMHEMKYANVNCMAERRDRCRCCDAECGLSQEDSPWVLPLFQVNGVGRSVSHYFGYGLLDAFALVTLAKRWRSVPEQSRCEIPATHINKLIPAKSQVHIHLEVRDKDCADVRFLEHVQAIVTLSATRRGDIKIFLTSPGGTRSMLLNLRPNDSSRSGFMRWPFMTVHSWGENPVGVWQLEIQNEGRFLAKITDWGLVLYGTASEPGPENSERRGGRSPVSRLAGQGEYGSTGHTGGGLDEDHSPFLNSRDGGGFLQSPGDRNHLQTGGERETASAASVCLPQSLLCSSASVVVVLLARFLCSVVVI
ncbi:unnamed protein product [Cyprideis torosa]|uniref:Uncharacterized protein n=1 Tax=Cyprideis torosa TaxID=163714 RepID=A0A7R8W6Q0_9CRUS|nr:unnamed protein product [Cyprideis torosa]CAG0885462.1 unnamed protein product [Cyprideis torosa]